ncbi:Hypothetical protein SRAE_1000294000 [Strongyloides ratti]|uniref:Uncharacterized protein n=1 Tax=Strongyloides ratti TaxID=34506 RepID=A0A090L4S2_STRRB|nr:Hypothetical protein SRAE_1000294000 [Strongyloides ratti]CEF64687.1 Hypothetical protein SRAE_1000294000 [Strongyloides ratti]
MVSKSKKKLDASHSSELNVSFKTNLYQKQNQYDEKIKENANFFDSVRYRLIDYSSDVLLNVITSNLPDEFLDTNYKEFMSQISGSSFHNFKLNDTLAAIQKLRNKVTSGSASEEEIKKYKEVKKLL